MNNFIFLRIKLNYLHIIDKEIHLGRQGKIQFCIICKSYHHLNSIYHSISRTPIYFMNKYC